MKDFYSLSVPENIDRLIRQEFFVHSFQQDFSIFYSGQVPNVAIYLVSGEIELSQGKEKYKVDPGHIVGLAHLYNQLSSKAGAKISAGAESVTIDRALLLLHLKKKSELGGFFQDYLSSADLKVSP